MVKDQWYTALHWIYHPRCCSSTLKMFDRVNMLCPKFVNKSTPELFKTDGTLTDGKANNGTSLQFHENISFDKKHDFYPAVCKKLDNKNN